MNTLSLYEKANRVGITKEDYHYAVKKGFKRGEDIVAIPQKRGNSYAGYKYYIRYDIRFMIDMFRLYTPE